jgi:hypothetical protein
MSINSDKEHLLRLQTARKATIEGFIKLFDLEYFLACDTSLSPDALTINPAIKYMQISSDMI